MLLRRFASRPVRAMALCAIVLLFGFYFMRTLPTTPSAIRPSSSEKVPLNETAQSFGGIPVPADLHEAEFEGPDGPIDIVDPVHPVHPVDPLSASTLKGVDGDDGEDDVILPPLHEIENLPYFSDPEVLSDDVGADVSDDALEGTREAFEQLMDDMDRDHAALEIEVENLVQAEDDKARDNKAIGDEPMARTDEALSKAHIDRAKAHWHNFDHMYKNIKDATREMQGYLREAGSKGRAAASKHTAEFLAAVKAAEGDEDIHRINLMHTTKRSVDGDAESDNHDTPPMHQWLDHLSEAKKRWIHCLTESNLWRFKFDDPVAKTEGPSRHRLSDEEIEQYQKEFLEAQKMYVEPEYFKKWLKENSPATYKERFGDDDTVDGNDKLAQRWLFDDKPRELSEDDIKLREWLKKEKPEYYRIHYAKEIEREEKKAKAKAKAEAKAKAKAEAKEKQGKTKVQLEAEREDDKKKELDEARRLEYLDRTKVVTTRLTSVSKEDFSEWLKEHHPKIYRGSYPESMASNLYYKTAHVYGNQDHSIPERVRKAMYEMHEYGISSTLFHDWLKEYFPEWRRETYSYHKDVIEERKRLGLAP